MVSYAWGGLSNGKIPTNRLTAIGGGNYLRDDAAQRFFQFAGAFKATFGTDLLVSEGYRDYAEQVRLKKYWTDLGESYKAAAPGGSIHGWALAIDIYSWVYGGSTNTAKHKWLRENAPYYGFDWYQTGAVVDEPWHFDYVGGGTAPAAITPVAEVKPLEGEDDMTVIRNIEEGHIFTVAPEFIKWNSNAFDPAVVALLERQNGTIQNVSAADIPAVLRGLGIPTNYADPNEIIKLGWDGVWSRGLEISAGISALLARN